MTTPDLQQEFQSLLSSHKRILYKICASYASTDDRDDLAQEIVIQLWRSFEKFDHERRFSTWMYRVALNVAISFYRKERRRTVHLQSGDEKLVDIADEACRPPEELRQLYEFIDGLEPLTRALVLLYLEGYSYAEISGVLGISETNVATRLSRIKKAMRSELAGNEEG